MSKLILGAREEDKVVHLFGAGTDGIADMKSPTKASAAPLYCLRTILAVTFVWWKVRVRTIVTRSIHGGVTIEHIQKILHCLLESRTCLSFFRLQLAVAPHEINHFQCRRVMSLLTTQVSAQKSWVEIKVFIHPIEYCFFETEPVSKLTQIHCHPIQAGQYILIDCCQYSHVDQLSSMIGTLKVQDTLLHRIVLVFVQEVSDKTLIGICTVRLVDGHPARTILCNQI